MTTIATDALPEQAERRAQVRTVIGAALGMSVGFATLFVATTGVFVDPVTAEFGWGQQEGALSLAAGSLGLALACPVVGRLMDRFGVRRVAFTCSVLFAALLASLSLQTGDTTLWVVTSLLVGVTGAATTVLGYLAVLPRWFSERLGLAIGLAMVGLGLGAAVAPLLAQSFIDRFGWRGAYVALAAVALVGSFGAAALIRERSPDQRSNGAGPGVHGVSTGPVHGARRKLLTIFAVAFLVSSATIFLGPQLSGLLRERTLDGGLVAQALALTGVGIFVGRLLTGLLLDRMHAPYVGSLFFVAGAAGLGILQGAQSSSAVLVASILVGLALGAEGDLLSYLVRVYLGLHDFGKNYGIAFAGYGLGAVVGPVAAGRYVDATGDYSSLLFMAAGSLVVACALLLTLGRYTRPARTDGPRPVNSGSPATTAARLPAAAAPPVL
jgi:MFS transporter, OFA family, oxalate/formate antiporter